MVIRDRLILVVENNAAAAPLQTAPSEKVSIKWSVLNPRSNEVSAIMLKSKWRIPPWMSVLVNQLVHGEM